MLHLFMKSIVSVKYCMSAVCLDPLCVFVTAADGTSDDIDVPLRKLFADPDLVLHHGLMSLNSVNWSRILVQLAHFLFAYLQLSMPQAKGDALPVLEVLVPTGGAGNITGTEQQTCRQHHPQSQEMMFS